MVKNYIVIAFRSLLKHKFFSIINVLGLSVSMSVCLLIILMIQDQLSYDTFNPNKDDIYRVTHTRVPYEVDLGLATVPLPLGEVIREEGKGVEEVIRFRRGLNGDVLNEGKAISLGGYFTDPAFFKAFPFEMLYGVQEDALTEPFSIVLTKQVAEKFFGTMNPVGELITVGDLGSFKVTGVLDEFEGKTHLQFDALSSINTAGRLEETGVLSEHLDAWDKSSSGWVYMLMQPGVSPKGLMDLLNRQETLHYNEDSQYYLEFDIQAMTDITPGPLMGNQIGTAMPYFFVYGLAILGLIIIASAGFNYTNLSIARALGRAKEVGIRKINGAKREHIIFQFLMEAVAVSVLSLGLSILLLFLLIPGFESLSMSKILSWDLSPNISNYIWFGGFSLLTGIIAGAFPAWFLSSFQPSQVLKNLNSIKIFSRLGLRKLLIVVQFSLCLILIITVTLVEKQLMYMIHKDSGFDKEHIVNIDLQGQDYSELKRLLVQLPFVDGVTPASNIPSTGSHNDEYIKKKLSDDGMKFYYYATDEHYIDQLGLNLLHGQNFPPVNSGDEKYVIINETAASALGFEENAAEAIGSHLYLEDSSQLQIIGVVQDYNFMMFFADILPMMLRYRPDGYNWAQVKIHEGGDLFANVDEMEAIWADFDPNHDFTYHFFEQQIEDFYATFYDLVYIIGLISVLAVSIACMGLLGMATYTAETRMKEIGIRKVLGATVASLIQLLGRSYFILLMIAVAVAAPLAYFGNQLWLNEFSYRVDFGLGIVGFGVVIMLVAGGAVIASQAVRASRANPIEHLRNE